MSKALESKHDKILKSLLRQPDNKRCINCETLVCNQPARPAIGFNIIWWIKFTLLTLQMCRAHSMLYPICRFSSAQYAAECSKFACHQYVCAGRLSGLNSGYCFACSRQFSHRVKGLSTSTFKPEEIKALEAGGNRVCLIPCAAAGWLA